MQFLYYKNKIIHLLHGKLPKSVFIWYIIFFTSIFISLSLIFVWYYDVYIIYNKQNLQSLDKDEYEPVLNLNEIEKVVNNLDL